MMNTSNDTSKQRHPHSRKVGLYIHLPFCQRKCDYCGFYSLDRQTDVTRKQYLDDLLHEIRMRKTWLETGLPNNPGPEAYVVDTIFIGGGTPSLYEGQDINRLLDGIRQSWQLDEQTEITMESNPNSLSFNKLSDYKQAGVNRLSIGIQSFDNTLLSQLGRLHNADCGETSVAMARQAGFDNISLDFMFGLPGQTMDQWTDTLERAVSLKPSHLSLYTLQLEEGTRYYQAYKSGHLPLLDHTLDRIFYHEAIALLKQYGYQKYEISNFAKSGRECLHNLKYWSMGEFFGFGPAASSYLNGTRWSNFNTLNQWSEAMQNGRLPVAPATVKADSRQDEIGIFMFTGLRKSEGISLMEFEDRFGERFFHHFHGQIKRLERYRSQGLLDWSDSELGNLWLTETGIDQSNKIMSEFV